MNEQNILNYVENAKSIYINFLKKNNFKNVEYVEKKLNELKVVIYYDEKSMLCAEVNNKVRTLRINTYNIKQMNSIEFYHILFHEFVHCFNSINITKDTFEDSIFCKFLLKNKDIDSHILNRFFKVSNYSLLMMDESIAEEISLKILEDVFNIERKWKKYSINKSFYESSFKSYTVFELVMEKFSKTLGELNINSIYDFAKKSFEADFMFKLCHQFNKNPKCYLELLSIMGYFAALYYSLSFESAKKIIEDYDKYDTVENYFYVDCLINQLHK